MDDKHSILNRIEKPSDLKGLTDEELDTLASQIREFLVESVTQTGGHLASNLGVVELTMAIHRTMDLPKDRVIFDVGHQSYVHKVLTGRRERFSTLRQGGGLSGFTLRSESEYDCFGAGHSSTSLSAALGFARAEKLKGSDAYTVAVIGDGAYTGGMIHEALNNCDSNLKLIIIINENEMSISKNTGRFAKSLAKLRTGKRYLKTKRATRNFVRRIPLIGGWLFRRIRDVKKIIKNIFYGSNYFENLGLYYLGPVNGNDRKAVERLINEAKAAGKSAVIHVKTVKGYGYKPAEADPNTYHGMSPIDCIKKPKSFSSIAGECLCKMAERDNTVCAITASMKNGTGLCAFADKYPKRFFDVGIAEPHALTFAAGLAADGMKPVVCIYSTFLQRAYDNVLHDIALQDLPVTVCVDRAGLNTSDGPTHHGIFDVAYISHIPNMTIYTPITYGSVESALTEAVNSGVPCVVRYPNGCENGDVVRKFYGNGDYSVKTVRPDFSVSDAPNAIIITHGRMVEEAMKAERIAYVEGISVGIVLLEKLKPYEKTAEALLGIIPKETEILVFVEEEIRNGGMGMLLRDAIEKKENGKRFKTAIIATDDSFAVRTVDEDIKKTVGIDANSIVEKIKGLLH